MVVAVEGKVEAADLTLRNKHTKNELFLITNRRHEIFHSFLGDFPFRSKSQRKLLPVQIKSKSYRFKRYEQHLINIFDSQSKEGIHQYIPSGWIFTPILKVHQVVLTPKEKSIVLSINVFILCMTKDALSWIRVVSLLCGHCVQVKRWAEDY